MGKIRMLGLTLVAMVALGAVLADVASAETTLEALWLVNGSAIAAELAIALSGGLTIEDTKVPVFGSASVLCSVGMFGNIKVGGSGEIERFYNLMNEPISSTPLMALSLALLCEAVETCEGSLTDIEVWPENLPWATLLFLTEGGEFLYLIEKMAFEIECLVDGMTTEDLCEDPSSAFAVDNETGAQIPAGVVALPLGTCDLGGAGSSSIQTDELIYFTLPPKEGELTASSASEE